MTTTQVESSLDFQESSKHSSPTSVEYKQYSSTDDNGEVTYYVLTKDFAKKLKKYLINLKE